ncbi:MAG: late competence development ComFB family protein [Candidatus Omnitrophota bacterium]
MEFRNYMEELVTQVFNDLISKDKKACKCQRCRIDIVALALNNLPAKYAVTDMGRAYVKMEAIKAQFQVDVIKELTKAIEKVKNNPRHVV